MITIEKLFITIYWYNQLTTRTELKVQPPSTASKPNWIKRVHPVHLLYVNRNGAKSQNVKPVETQNAEQAWG